MNSSKIRRASLVRKPLVLLTVSALASMFALPAAAAAWWHATPTLTIGTASINVRDTGAIGDGVHNDTAAIQAAINAMPTTGGTVVIPAGTYMIDATRSIRMHSNMRLQLDPNAQLVAIPNDRDYSYVVRVWNVSNVEITGGAIVGERARHVGTTGEHGMGISMLAASSVFVHDMQISDCWGDGLYVGATGSGSTLKVSQDVTINRVVSTNNRRQGLSITPAYHVYVTNSTFSNTNGTLPEAGIDVEPMTQGPTQGVRLENNQLVGNHGNGLEVHDNVSGLMVKSNTIQSNRGFGIYTGSPYRSWIQYNTITLNGLAGVAFMRTSHDIELTNNSITSNSTRYLSPLTKSYDTTRDLKIGTGTYNLTISGNTLSPLR